MIKRGVKIRLYKKILDKVYQKMYNTKEAIYIKKAAFYFSLPLNFNISYGGC